MTGHVGAGSGRAGGKRAYFDYNATAPLLQPARAAMVAALAETGNASSIHADGRRARALVETARDAVAALVGADPRQVVFTSGASEACNAVVGAGYDVIALSGLEHACVWEPAVASGARLVEVAVTGAGTIDLADLERKLAVEDLGAPNVTARGGAARRGLLCLQLANNETGVIQPVAEAAALARARGFGVFADAVQAAGRIPVDMAALGVDLLAVSSHKLGGPQGAGAIVAAPGFAIEAMIRGGGQERGRRGGTENVAAIAGFGAAARWWSSGRLDHWREARATRDVVGELIASNIMGARIIGAASLRLPNTILFTWPGRRAETLVIKFDLGGVSLSAGAACSSGKVGRSRVLAAMGLDEAEANSAVRVSFGPSIPVDDLELFVGALASIRGEGPGDVAAFKTLRPAVQRRLEMILGEH